MAPAMVVPSGVMDFDELEFVQWLSSRAARTSSLRVGIGDDMATVDLEGHTIAVASDLLLDGVHFDRQSDRLDLIGRKALACCLSDCAAMAVRPRAVTVSVAFPRAFSMDEARLVYEGLFSLADEYQVVVGGGDTTRWSGGLVIDVAMLATPWKRRDPITRSGARAGDRVYVTGPLGGSRLGHHLQFTPRVNEARSLVETLGPRLHAMIDVSDGLSLDLWRLCRASNVGAVLREDGLAKVISDDAGEIAAQDGWSPLAHVLTDGEDFELLAAIEGDVVDCDVALFEIGTIAPSGYHLLRTSGVTEPLEPKGYLH